MTMHQAPQHPHRPRRAAWVPAGLAAVLLAGITGLPAAPAAVAAGTPAAATCQGQPAAWMNTRLSPDQRASLLVSQMTLDQEVQETASVSTATESREVPAIGSLCVPALLLTNGSAGISTGGPVQEPATALPAPISLAATWDPAAAAGYGRVEGAEALDQGRNDVEGPDINIARVPVNGRTFEAYGEDPYLAGQIAAGNVTGIQSQGVIATAKHYDANNQETNRTTINEIIDQRTLREIYMPAFQAAVQAGTGSVMCSKNLVNGTHACDSAALIGVLENDWHFPGFVVSDFSSIHSTVQAAGAGTSLELPSAQYFGPALASAVQGGQVSKQTVDEMVRRIFSSMFRLGLFDRPAPAPMPIPAAQDGATAQALAQDGTVLLKNGQGTLPLDPGRLKSVALIGPGAATASTGGAGSPKVAPIQAVSPLQAIGADAARHHIAVSYAGEPPVNLGPPAIPAGALAPAGGAPGQHGLLAQYFNNGSWQGNPAVSRAEPYVDENALPPDGVNSGQAYSVRWSGTLTPEVSGPYTLSLTTHSRSSLYLNGEQIASDGGSFPAQTAGKTVNLTAGTPYPIEMDYATSGMAVAELSWQPPAGSDNPLIDQAVQAAKASQVAVVFAGDQEAEGVDRPDLSLPGFQDQLIQAVAQVNPHTVVVLNTGGPVLMPWLDQVPTVLESWYPGEQDGNAIAAVLFGQANPSGKLPITFPASSTAVPASTPAQYPGVNGTATYSEGLRVGYRYDDAAGITPLFPFGYGLSYTSFAFSHLVVAGPGAPPGTVRVDAQVTNTGPRAGTEVAQLYIGDPAAAQEPPRLLRGFQRVTLQPGQSTVVHFSLPASALAYWDTGTQGWATAPGTYQVYVGDSSALPGLPLRGEFALGGG